MKRLHQIFKGGAMSSLAILLLFACFSVTQVQGQNCGWDTHYGKQMKDPGFLKQMKELINRTDQQAKTLNGGTGLTEVEIPIVFHIVHKGTSVGVGDNFNYVDVTDALARLNSDFSGSGISFCPAQRDEAGNQLDEPGVVRVDASGVSEYMSSGITIGTQVEFDVKGLGTQFSNYNYCNVWVVSNILGIGVNGQIQGVGYFPNTVNASIDGIMIRSAIFDNALNRVITHEAGHYLGLFHTFTGDDPDYDGANFICPADADFPLGDGIADTQPHIRSASGTCPSGNNPCPTGGMLEDISNNHMDYSGESCRNNFTANQVTKMLETVDCLRKGLIHSLGCELGCPPPGFTVDYTHTPTNPFANDSDDPVNEPGDNTVFSNTSNSTTYIWYVDGVEQTMMANSDLNFVFQTPGDHTVCLVETGTNCTIETCKTINVFSQGTCTDVTLEACELLLNGDLTQVNEDEVDPFDRMHFFPPETQFTNLVCNWMDYDQENISHNNSTSWKRFPNGECLFESSYSNNSFFRSEDMGTISPLNFIDGFSYKISFDYHVWNINEPDMGFSDINFLLTDSPGISDNSNDPIICSTGAVPSNGNIPTQSTILNSYDAVFTYDESTMGKHLYYSTVLAGSDQKTMLFISNISVTACNVCDADPSFTFTNECGSFQFDGVDGNPNSNGIISWTINGETVPGSVGLEDLDFNFPFEDNFEVCMNITCPYGGTVQFCETVFTGGTTINGIACEVCQNPETVNVSAQRCGEDSNEFLVESFAISVPDGYGPCLGDFALTQPTNGTVFTNDYYIDENGIGEDIIYISFTFLADNPNDPMSAIFAVCGPNGETLCFQFVIDNPTTCDTCEDAAPQLVTDIEVACDDDNPNDGVQKYSGSYTVNLGTTDVEFCGATSTNSGFSTQMTSVGINGSFDFDFNICTNQEGSFNVPVTLCFIDNSGKEPRKRCFNFNIAVNDPCPPPSECEFVAAQVPISCVNVKEGVANFLLASSHAGSELIEQGFVFCEDNPITGEHVSLVQNAGVGISSYLFSVELAIPCEEVANVGSTTITLNLCHPNGKTYCYDIQYDLECDECAPSCDIVIPPVKISCDNVKDGVANFAFSYAYHSPQLIQDGFVYCDDNPITGDHITIPPSTNIGIAAYLFQVELAMSCEDVANGGSTSITLNLCNPNGKTVCVELQFILECDECSSSCDETVEPLILECKSIKDGVAKFNISFGYSNTALMDQGFIFCQPNPLSGEYFDGPYLTHITKDAYTFGTSINVPCKDLKERNQTSITMHLCDANGNTFCVEIPITMECKHCEETIDGKLSSRHISENDYKVYPNPSTGNVYIEAPISTFQQSYIIYDMTGKVMLTGKISEGNNLIDLSNNLNGLYHIQIKNGTDLFQQKIVIID